MDHKIFCVLILSFLASGVLPQDEEFANKPPVETSPKRAISKLPVKEKDNFVFYLLAKGLKAQIEESGRPPKFMNKRPDSILNILDIPKEQKEKFESLNISKESTVDLVKWYRNEFNLTAKSLYYMIKNKKCPPNVCLNEIGVGDICCPW